LSGDKTPNKKEKSETFEFDCPECGAHIVGPVDRCPNCGIEFIFEDSEEFKCPVCGEVLPPDATTCPKCGAEFDILVPDKENEEVEEKPVPEEVADTQRESNPHVEESQQEEFPRLVAEVKPMMALAKEFGVEVTEARGLIDKAVNAGKKGELDLALKNVRECKTSIDSSIQKRVRDDLENLEKLKLIATKMGEDPSPIQESIDLVSGEMESGDLDTVLTRAREGMRSAETLTGKYIESQNLIKELELLLENAERFYIDTKEAHQHLDEAKAAETDGDYSMMGIMAKRGRDCMMQILPKEIGEELKRSKSVLMDAKAEGKDVAVPIKLLKDAASATKREKYGDALEKLVEFRSEMRRV